VRGAAADAVARRQGPDFFICHGPEPERVARAHLGRGGG
jgi:hypothetical protein